VCGVCANVQGFRSRGLEDSRGPVKSRRPEKRENGRQR